MKRNLSKANGCTVNNICRETWKVSFSFIRYIMMIQDTR